MDFGVVALTEAEAWAMCAALVMMLLDVVSGFVGALVRGDVSSTKMREGLGHKALLVIVMTAAALVQAFSSHVDMGWTVPLIVPCCVYIVAMEVASVLENVCSAYPELRDTPLMRMFDRASGTGGED